MGWFSKSGTSDTKARIEELKKKIQAEQQAYATSVTTPSAPATPPPMPPLASSPSPSRVEPVPVAPPPLSSPYTSAPAQPAPAPQEVEYVPPLRAAPEQPRQHHRSQFGSPAVPPFDRVEPAVAPRHERPREAFRPNSERAPHSAEVGEQHGVILDLGEGMSLNLPIRNRMHLEEFLQVAERVRELQRLERSH